jgi:mRNA interferase HicA
MTGLWLSLKNYHMVNSKEELAALLPQGLSEQQISNDVSAYVKMEFITIDHVNKIVYIFSMNSKEFKRWLSTQGAIFGTMKGSHLKVYLNGKQSILPMHNSELKKGLVDGIKKQLGLNNPEQGDAP